jgi:hypothetical protein
MRPPGEIRAALRQAAQQLPSGATWRELAQHACVGFGIAKRTVDNMRRAGELAPIDEVRAPGSRRPMVRYALNQGNFATATTGALDVVMRGWAR